jgi:hypothetical protein
MTIGLVPRRLYGEIEGQYVRLGNVGERAISVAATVQPVARFTARVSYHRASSSGGAEWRYLAARSDVKFGAIGLLGGFSLGSSAGPDAPVPAWQTLTMGSREFFAGSSFTTSRFQAVWAVSAVQPPAGHVDRLVAALRVPVGPRRQANSLRESTRSTDK